MLIFQIGKRQNVTNAIRVIKKGRLFIPKNLRKSLELKAPDTSEGCGARLKLGQFLKNHYKKHLELQALFPS